VLRVGRGWVEAEWRQAVDELSTAGLLDGRGELTESGAALRKRIEAGTDAVAMRPWELLGEIDTARLADLLTPLAAAIIDSGTLPMPNAVGLTRTLAVGAQPTASARGAAESSSGHSSAMTASNGSTS
jgi:Helix-turn-helix family